MKLRKWIGSLIGSKESQRYRQVIDFEGINFLCSQEQIVIINQGKADDLVTQQHVVLRMLIEEDLGLELANGFAIPSLSIVNLDEYSRELLEIPSQWNGVIRTDIQGQTGQSSFNVNIQAKYSEGRFTSSFKINGPIIRFSEEKQFLLTPDQLQVFEAIKSHQDSKRTEFDNLTVIAALQLANRNGVEIELGHFDKLKIHVPESISVEAELGEDGNLLLTPQLGQKASHEEMQRVLGQLRNADTASLRVNDEIILIDERKMAGIQEVLRNRIVSKEKLNDFYRNPTAFIDGSLVNLELGFSARVKGAARFRHAYFGETDDSGIDWFGKKFTPVNAYPISKLKDTIKDEEQLCEFEATVDQARIIGALEIEFADKVFDISDAEQVTSVTQNIRKSWLESGHDSSDLLIQQDSCEFEKDLTPVVVDIDLNDSDLETPSKTVERLLEEVFVPENSLCWDNYLRSPFSHQVDGVRWLLGLAIADDGLGGGLLADDMGLGKTFMSLSAIEHLYREFWQGSNSEKPCLIVAPLSLLQNWKDEVEKTFVKSPFRDIVILQSEGELSKFRLAGVETKNQILDSDEAEIRYSLKIGADFGHERLDMPKRLVITTYQTLRDYQFSLCAIDWGVVTFDEAQNIKNPNALQTRAAKGLKAQFRLLATGTPVENSLADFWCIMDTACPGYLGSYQSFRDTCIKPIIQAAGDEIEEVRARVGRQLRERVGALMLRRLKEDNLKGLPEKRLYVGVQGTDWQYMQELESFMEGEQLTSYDSALSGVKESEENMVLAGLHQLRDISLHHRLLLGGHLNLPTKQQDLDHFIAESGKLKSLLYLLRSIQSRSEKVIIFCINKRLQSFLSVALGRCFALPPLPIINGDTKAVAKKASGVTRKTLIESFESKEGFNIIIMSPVAAGVGLTVVGANNVIHLERHWNPAKEAQATDRVYRIGQKKNVNVYIPTLMHPELISFDENLHHLLSKKSLLRDAVVTPEQVMPSPEGFVQRGFSDNKIIMYDEIQSLGWQEFEAFVAELLSTSLQATSTMLTASGSDHGADVVIDLGDGVALVQCKHTSSSNNYSGYAAVAEVYAAKPVYEKYLSKPIERLIFVTNATRIAGETRQIAKDYGVEVVDGKDLARLMCKMEISFTQIISKLTAKRLKV